MLIRVRFNPRPSLLTGEPGTGDHIECGDAGFQSTPVTADGRTNAISSDLPRHQSFNPRPSLLTGEPRRRAPARCRQLRFNPRPSLLTGEPSAFCFSSISMVSFNPRPSLLTGEPRSQG